MRNGLARLAGYAGAAALLLCASALAVGCGTTATSGTAGEMALEETDEARPAPSPSAAAESAPGPHQTPRPVERATFPQRIDYGEDPAQYGWLRWPAQPEGGPARLPIVVLIHGGFWSEPWDYRLMTEMSERLLAEGYGSFNIEFRRVGGRGGWPGTFDDVSAAIAHLRILAQEHPIDLDRVVVAGHSSGGHLALWAVGAAGAHADVLRPARAVGIAAVTDLDAFSAAVTFLGGTRSAVPERWAFAEPSLDPAVVELVHGADDDIVPLDTVTNATAAGVGVTDLPAADHFDVIDPGPTLDQVVKAVIGAVEATRTPG